MPISIRTKLFAILLLTTILVVIGMYAFTRWSLDKGFAAFVESRRREHIENLVGTLSEYYGENNGWSELAGDKRRWIKLLMQSDTHRHYRSVPLLRQALNEAPGEWPPQLPELQTEKRFLPLEFRVMLLDSDKSIIFGRRDRMARLSLNPILRDGRIVGYLGVLPGKPPKQLGEIRFMERQGQSFILIALTMVLLSAGLALLLSYALGRPLKRMADAAKALAVGRYNVRLPVDSNDELGQLARNFNETAAALERSELARRRWVADISH
ncbi:MAG: HAMP domain-containing protein [Gammaproteobacteria bacterium]